MRQPPTMRLADDPALVIHASGAATRCLGRERDGSDRASAEAMAARLVATGVTEVDHPLVRR